MKRLLLIPLLLLSFASLFILSRPQAVAAKTCYSETWSGNGNSIVVTTKKVNCDQLAKDLGLPKEYPGNCTVARYPVSNNDNLFLAADCGLAEANTKKTVPLAEATSTKAYATAQNNNNNVGGNVSGGLSNALGSANSLGIPKVEADQSAIGKILSAVFLILGSLAAIIVVFGGVMYVTSAGSPDQTKRAKDTILYAIVGLIVSLLAFTLVSFITGRFS